MQDEDPDRLVPYPLRWPAWLADQTAKAAKARTTSVADYIRTAVLEKLERDKKGQR
jgi:hypothetical protein